MRFSTAIYTGLLAIAANAAPFKRADAITDGDVLNYALTLEHLEAAFYKGALDSYDASAFEAAGYPDWVRNRAAQISAHETSHVEFLTTALKGAGVTPTEACTYEFGLTDPASFIATAGLLEAVGSSAYTGAAQFIATKDYLTAAASILSIEARHASWIGSAAGKSNPWGGAFETPLSFNQVYTIASAFITGCPESNPALPVKAFPKLAVTPATSGEASTFDFESSGDDKLYAVILSGLSAQYVELSDKKATFPEGLCGPSYILVSKKQDSYADEDVVAGPIVTRLPCDSKTDPNAV